MARFETVGGSQARSIHINDTLIGRRVSAIEAGDSTLIRCMNDTLDVGSGIMLTDPQDLTNLATFLLNEAARLTAMKED